jgi:hypothetical protein
MKKYALISSVLAISMTSNCMEKKQQSITIAQQTEFSTKNQKRINKEIIPEMRTILRQKDQILSQQKDLYNKLNNETRETKKNVIRAKIEVCKEDCELAYEQLHFFLESELISKEEKQYNAALLQSVSENPRDIVNVTTFYNTNIRMRQKMEYIQQFAENQLKTNKGDELFIMIHKKSTVLAHEYAQIINDLMNYINNCRQY